MLTGIFHGLKYVFCEIDSLNVWSKNQKCKTCKMAKRTPVKTTHFYITLFWTQLCMYHTPKHIHLKKRTTHTHTHIHVGGVFSENVPKVFDQKNPASLEVPTLDAMALTTSAFSVSFSVRGGPWLCWCERKDGDMQGRPMLCYKWSYKMGNWDYNPTYMGL